jgi:hypothetical protein
MGKATYQDAQLMIQIHQLWSAPAMEKAFMFVYSDEFVPNHEEFMKKYPKGSPEWFLPGKVCSLYEMIGGFYKYELIDKEYLFDNIEVKSMWEKMKDLIRGVREETGNQRFYELFEMMANDPRA